MWLVLSRFYFKPWLAYKVEKTEISWTKMKKKSGKDMERKPRSRKAPAANSAWNKSKRRSLKKKHEVNYLAPHRNRYGAINLFFVVVEKFVFSLMALGVVIFLIDEYLSWEIWFNVIHIYIFHKTLKKVSQSYRCLIPYDVCRWL